MLALGCYCVTDFLLLLQVQRRRRRYAEGDTERIKEYRYAPYPVTCTGVGRQATEGGTGEEDKCESTLHKVQERMMTCMSTLALHLKQHVDRRWPFSTSSRSGAGNAVGCKSGDLAPFHKSLRRPREARLNADSAVSQESSLAEEGVQRQRMLELTRDRK
ncbi:hypothetical protein J6590_058331 [Homalodisca vitripennis]|nr:hypothetical protein J6590_058331 [Homalodisca vitripennis]